MPELALFPLGTVLLPHMALPLHVFEPRYRALLHDLLHTPGNGPPEFGVVLIDRGHEVGGGDERSDVGTVARIVQAEELEDGRWLVVALGTRRFQVQRWLPDDPYPRAVVSYRSDRHDDAEVASWTARLAPKVRHVLALRQQLGDEPAGPDFDVSPTSDVACWQPAVAVPLTPLDAQQLVVIDDCGRRLAVLDRLLDGVEEALTFRLGGTGR